MTRNYYRGMKSGRPPGHPENRPLTTPDSHPAITGKGPHHKAAPRLNHKGYTAARHGGCVVKAARRRKPTPIAPASVIAPFGRRRGWMYTYPCRTCGAHLAGWARTLDAVTGERRAGCGHRVHVMAARIYSQPEQPEQGSGVTVRAPTQRFPSLAADNDGLRDTEIAEQPRRPLADVQQAADDGVLLAFAGGWRCGLEAAAERGGAA